MSELFDKVSRCNFWDGGLPDTGVSRRRYVERVQPFMGNRLTKVLMGQRRCGKSFILRQIMAGLVEGGVSWRNILYLDKERMELADLVDHRQAHDLIGDFIGFLFVFIIRLSNVKLCLQRTGVEQSRYRPVADGLLKKRDMLRQRRC